MIVFVHGVPETAAIWDKVRAAIGEHSVSLSMPGFGCPRPDGFAATKEAYTDWLVAELAAIDDPVDLVGHDWGAGLTYRVATAHGDSVRSWVADVGNIAHPEYEWHDFAKIWQTPGEGEGFFAQQQAQSAEERGALYQAFGIDADDALAMASWADDTMSACILALYRSATPNPHADWQSSWGPTAAPGMIITPSDDPFGDEAKAIEVAESLGARHERLDGAGHWWPFQAPDRAAELLKGFWASVR